MGQMVKNLPASVGRCKRRGFDPWVRKIPWRREWLPTPVFWPGEFHGLCPWGRKELDTAEGIGSRQAVLVSKARGLKEGPREARISHL